MIFFIKSKVGNLVSINQDILKANDLHRNGNLKEAEEIYNQILKNDSKNFNALQLLGYLKYQKGNFNDAKPLIEKALEIYSGSDSVLHNYGLVLIATGEIEKSIQYFDKVIKINNNHIKAWFEKGVAFSKLNEFNKAIDCFDKVLSINNNEIDALYNKGILYQKKKDYENSFKTFSKIIKLDEKYPLAYGYYIISKLSLSIWNNYESDLKKIKDLILNQDLVCDPFIAKSFINDEKINQKCSQNFFKFKYKHRLFKISFNNTKKHNVVFVSSDFKKHSVAYQMLDFFNYAFKKNNIFFFSIGNINKSDEIYKIISKFNNFYDLRNSSDDEIIELSKKLNIHIAIDLNGYTSGFRTSLFLKRLAQIQINYFGFAGTMGSNCYDYILADKICIPEKSKKYYNEKVLYLPNCFIPSNKNISYSHYNFSKKDFNIPENQFIYCCFNQNYKFNPLVFDAWSRILISAKNSILWLLETNEVAKKNILNEIIKKKINPNRIVFAKFLPREEHLARFKLVDLFLDTFPFNGHTMVYDSLYMGIPVLTIKGQDFSGRVASSMLETINLNELITIDLNEYIKKAVRISKNKSELTELKLKVINSKENSSLFDTQLYAKNLEKILNSIN